MSALLSTTFVLSSLGSLFSSSSAAPPTATGWPSLHVSLHTAHYGSWPLLTTRSLPRLCQSAIMEGAAAGMITRSGYMAEMCAQAMMRLVRRSGRGHGGAGEVATPGYHLANVMVTRLVRYAEENSVEGANEADNHAD